MYVCGVTGESTAVSPALSQSCFVLPPNTSVGVFRWLSHPSATQPFSFAVYDYSHVGHARVYVAFDVLYRMLVSRKAHVSPSCHVPARRMSPREMSRSMQHGLPQLQRAAGYDVTYCRNFTDIDDKIIARANESGEDPLALASRFAEEFRVDMEALHCLAPSMEPKATDHVADMVATIERIVENGHAYQAGGDVYFDVASLEGYGRLSGRAQEDNMAGASQRVDAVSRQCDRVAVCRT